jgi:uncharacterized repeat protein (TIGR03806 family)
MRQNKLSDKMRETSGIICLLLLLSAGQLFIMSCSTDSVEQDVLADTPNIPPVLSPHEHLSDYNIFTGELKKLSPVDRLVPYDLNTQLFTDYAEKLRFAYVPADKKIEISESNDFTFPVGTILVKNFFYSTDKRRPEAGRTLIETRLLIRYDDGWQPNTYVWNSDQTEATLLRTGDTRPFSWIDREGLTRNVSYSIPSRNDCGTCHGKRGSITPLGPEIKNLNKEYTYSDGAENQLEKWRSTGFFSGTLDHQQLAVLPVWDEPETGPLNLRARAYLDVNCSSCHNRIGSARNSGLFLTYEEQNEQHLGICKIPVAAGFVGEDLNFNIVPGNPDKSILVHRMNSTDPNIRMPELGRTLIHKEAVELIEEWIRTMDLPPCDSENP